MRCSIGDHVADLVAATAAAIMLAITVLGFGAGCDSSRTGAPAEVVDRATNDVQIARLRRHFAAVDAELRAADVSHLTALQRAARAEAIARLRAYAARGEFPHNHHRAARTPVFVDEHGTRCAMAHLIEEAGGAELAHAIARAENLAHIPELAADTRFQPELVAWLDRNGLTAAEAARIQPAYNGCEFEDCSDDVDRSAVIASIGLAGANGFAISANLRDDASRGAGGVGLVLGGITMLVGHAMKDNLDQRRELQKDMAWLTMGVGAVTTVVSLRTLMRDRAPASAPPAGPVGPSGWSVAPIVSPTSGGVSFATTF